MGNSMEHYKKYARSCRNPRTQNARHFYHEKWNRSPMLRYKREVYESNRKSRRIKSQNSFKIDYQQFEYKKIDPDQALRMFRKHSEENHQLRMQAKPGYGYTLSAANYAEIGKKAYDRMKQLYHYLRNWEDATINKRKSDKELIEKFQAANMSTKNRCRDIIKKKIDEGVNLQILKSTSTRRKLEITSVPMYLDEPQFSTTLNRTAVFEYSARNVIESRSIFLQSEELRKLSELHKIPCRCQIKGRGLCPCYKMEGKFRETIQNDPKERRSFTCSKNCQCNKCGNVFPEPPLKGTEVLMHHRPEKGFVLRSVQYFEQGEAVVEMTGKICRTESLSDSHQYAIDIYDHCDAEAIKRCSKIYSKTYQRAIRRIPLLNERLSLDPTEVGNSGRFVSSSCFPNSKINCVYTKGIDPTGIRVIMTSMVPIFPNQEITFGYNDAYIIQQLREICLCGNLGCIKNLELFPFITQADMELFFKTLYEKLHKDYKTYVKAAP